MLLLPVVWYFILYDGSIDRSISLSQKISNLYVYLMQTYSKLILFTPVIWYIYQIHRSKFYIWVQMPLGPLNVAICHQFPLSLTQSDVNPTSLAVAMPLGSHDTNPKGQ